MRKILLKQFSIVFLLLMFLLPQYAFAQLTGTKTIPGDYATIEDAITALNTLGVGTGGVTFDVAANHTETFTSDSAGHITATGTVSDPIVFQMSGTGSNPLITASGFGTIASSTVNGNNGDGIIFIEGGDYITFDAIDLQENVAATGVQFSEYGYYLKKLSGDDACKNVTIKNCTITLDKATKYSYGIYISNRVHTADATVTSIGGRTENVKVFNNSISDCYGAIQIRGDAAAAPRDLYDQNIEIGVDGGNIITNFGGGTSSCYPIYAIYQNGLKVANNSIIGGAGQTSTLYGIYLSTGYNSDVDVYNNTITLQSDATTSSFYALYVSMGGTGTTNTVNIYNNTIENCTRPAVTSGSWYMMYRSSSAFNVNIYGNTIRNNTKAGTGIGYLLYSTGGGAGGTESIYNNNIYNNTNGTGTMYCLRSGAVSTTTRTVNNNNVYSNSGGGTTYGLYSTSGATVNIYQNNVYDITGGSTVYGLYKTSGVTINVYENNIYDIESTTTSTSVAYGIYSSTGTDVYYYNNFLSDIKAPSSTSTLAGTRGIYISSGTNVGMFYNTVYLDYTGAASNNSAAFYASTSTTSLDLRNNIFINNVDNSAGGDAFAFRGSGTAVLTDLAATTNNNVYYAGTPSATNLIYYDGTNTAQTLSAYQTLVAPLESASISENPPFVNSTVTPYDLHINTTIATQLESGGTPVAAPIAVTTDYDGDTRNVTTPDIGADEFTGIGADLTPPLIAYTLLPNTDFNSTSVSLTATITDASGVASGTDLPRLYIKKTTDVSYVFDNNPTISVDDYTFTINYTAISGISAGDTIEYYVAAQDIPGNAGTNPAGGSGSSPPGTTPPTTPNTYIIVDLPMSGTYTVGLAEFMRVTGKQVYFETRTRTVTRNVNGEGAGEDFNDFGDDKNSQMRSPDLTPRYETITETYKVLMENGKPFDLNYFRENPDGIYPTVTSAVNDLNLRGMTGAVTFSLVDTFYPNETYPIVIGAVNGASASNTITIKPALGIQTEIPGDIAQTEPTILCEDCDWLIIDGSNTVSGTTKDLKIVGLAVGTYYAAIYLNLDASNNVFKNLILESQETSTGSGTFVFGAGPYSMDNNLIQNCTIKNIDTLSARPQVGVYFWSSNTSTGSSIVGCDIFDFDDYGFRLQGAPSVNTLVSECDVYMTDDASTGTTYGAYVSRVEGLIIEKSIFRNFRGGTVKGIYISGNSTSGDYIIRNNFISLAATADVSGLLAGLDYWGYAANSVEAYHNSIYLGGTGITGSSTTYALALRDDALSYKAYNNAVYNARSNGTGTGKHYAVYVYDTLQVTREMDYNDYFVDGTGGVFGYYQGTGDIADLPTWKVTTGMDANSVSGNPGFVGNDDLHVIPSQGTLDSKALYFATVPDDIDGDTRNVTTPDIGADEYTYVPPVTPIFSISPDSVDFGIVNLGSSSLDQTFTITNVGVGTLTITSGNISLVGADASQFVLTDGNTYPINLGPSATATVDVNFTPTTAGAKTAALQIVDNTTDATHTVPLIGTGFDVTVSTFPYVEAFENGGSIPAGWEQDVANTEDWKFSTSAGWGATSDHTTGTGYLAWIDDSTPDNAIPSNLITPPMDISGLTAPTASFYYWIGRAYSGAGASFLHVDVYNGTTWTNDVIAALTANNGWAGVDIDLTTYKSTGTKVRFRAMENVGDFHEDPCIDDFSVYDNTNPPNCATNVSPVDAATDVAIDTDLTWSSGGGGATGYILYFGTDGGGVTPPTNLVNGTDLGNVTTYDHPSDIAYATTYYWQVIAYNSFGNATGCSIWSFTTGADPTITTFPYVENFDTGTGTTPPAAWVQDPANVEDWEFINNAQYAGSDHTSGSGMVAYVDDSTPYANPSNLISPPFDISGLTTPYASFFYWIGLGNAGPSELHVDVYNGSTWTDDVITPMVENNMWAEVSVDLTAYKSTGTKVRFRGIENLSGFNCDVSIDDFSVIDLVNPPNPANNVSPADSATGVYIFADLIWSSGGGIPLGYKLYFGTDGGGTTPPTNLVNGTDLGDVTSYDHPTDISYATTYYWQVVPYNGNGNATGCPIWRFTTMPDPTVSTFPFVETFEEDSPSRVGWVQIQEAGNGLWTYAVGSNGAITTAYEDSLNARFVSQSGTNSPITKLVSPPLDLTSVVAPRVTFAYGQPVWAGDQNELKVYYRVSSSDPWVEIAHYTDDVSVWTETFLYLPNQSATYQIAFEGINNYGYANVLDSVTVEQGPPDDVGTVSIDIAANITPGSFTPQATVMNVGSNTNTFNVTMEIDGYTSTKTVTSLASGVSQQVTFDSWDPALGSHTVKVYTMLSDPYPSNDTLWSNIVVTPGLFTSGSPFLDATYMGSGVGVNGYLYSIGGNTNSGLNTECYKYNVATDTWTQIALLPAARGILATANVGNFIYAFGGSDGVNYQSTVFRYNITTDTWETGVVADIPITHGWGKAVSYQDSLIYLAGGYDGTNYPYLSSVYVYNINTDTWTTATAMPVAAGGRIGGAFSRAGNKLVYVGGADYVLSIVNTVLVGTIDAVDPTLITWVTAENRYPGIGNELISRYNDVNPTELIVGEKDKTSISPEVTYPPGTMFRFDAAPWGTDRIIVSNGSPASAWVPADPCPTYAYDPVTDTWEVQAILPIPVLGASLGTVNSGNIWKLIVASGYNGSAAVDATQIYTADLGGATTFPLSVTVEDTWNMVSIPGLHPTNQDVTTWWPNLIGGKVFKFDNGYVDVTTVVTGEGYWLNNSGAETYTYAAIDIVTHASIPVVAGWSMIGGYENTAPVSSLIPSAGTIISVFKFSNLTGYVPTTDLVPGYGYWINMSDSGNITIPDPSPLSKGSGEVVKYIQEDWGKITITDNAGRSYTLYAVNGAVDLNKYELPPVPPSGMFDIRYGSGRIAEDINSSIQSIEMSGLEYPITVKVENMDIRLQDETGKEINENMKSGDEITISNTSINKLMVSGELIPEVYALEQNYPNPFNPSTTIEFSLPEDVSNVKLTIYDILGQRVTQLVNTSLKAGKYSYQWNAGHIATGMYIYELRTDKFVSVKKMMLLK